MQNKTNQENVKIEHLAENIDAVSTLASWIIKEWGHLLPEANFDTLVSELKQRTTVHRIPETFVALVDGRVIGTASIVEHDMLTRKELSPWLAAVFVVPEYRNRGIGSKLVRRVMQEAEILGLNKLYLFTPDRMRFYSCLGWNILESTEYRGEKVIIMFYEVG